MKTELKTVEAIRDWLVKRVADKLKRPAQSIRTNVPFDEYGLDSVAAVAISGELGELLQRDFPGTLLYEYSTIDELSAHLAGASSPRES